MVNGNNNVVITISAHDTASAAIAKVRSSTSSMVTDFAALGQKAAIGFGLVGAAATALVIATGFSFNNLKQQATIAFSTMLGSGEKAKIFLNELQRFAAKTPFEFTDLIRASQRLAAFGFEAGRIIPTLTAVGDAAAALGASPETINRITLALGQMQAKGKVSGEEMRQLAEAGIPAWEIIATKIGVSIPDAMKKAEAGAISASVGVNALVEGMETRFAGMMEAQSHTFGGLLSTIKDTFAIVSGQVMEPFFERTTKAMQSLVDLTSSPKFIAGVQTFAAVLDKLMSEIGQHKEIIVGFGAAAAGAFAIATAAAVVWVGTLIAVHAPIIALIVAIGLLAAAGYKWRDTIGDAIGSVAEMWDALWGNIGGPLESAYGAIKSFAQAFVDAIASAVNTVIDLLNKIQIPDWIPGIGGKGIDIPHVSGAQVGGAMAIGLGVPTGLIAAGTGVGGKIGGALGGMFEGISGGIDDVRSTFQGFVDAAKAAVPGLTDASTAVAGLGSAADGAGSAAKAAAEELAGWQKKFIDDQVQAYLEGGQAQLEAVRASQSSIVDRASVLAAELVNIFGLKVPDAMQRAIEFISASADALLAKAKKVADDIFRMVGSGDAFVQEQLRGMAEAGMVLIQTSGGTRFGSSGSLSSGESVLLNPQQFYPQVTINGDVYGYDDFAGKVASAVNTTTQEGGFYEGGG